MLSTRLWTRLGWVVAAIALIVAWRERSFTNNRARFGPVDERAPRAT
jgi:hypothetical protein